MTALINDYGAALVKAIGIHTVYAVSYTHLPMGLEELTSCKYVIYGEGQIR